MKKMTRRILTAFAVTAFFAGGVMAQGIPDANYTDYDATDLAPADIEYVTVGATMGYYADPDAVYHPTYAAASTLTGGFVWNWTVPTDPGTAATVTSPVGGFPANYATILFPVAGVYAVNVAEQAPAAFGGCTDATPTAMDVTAVAVPTGTASIAPGVGWVEDVANAEYQICGAQAAQTVTIAFNEGVPNTLGSYSFQITGTVENLNGAGGVTATPTPEAVIQDFPLASKVRTGNVGTLTAAAFNAATPAFTFTFSSDALALVAGARTRYTYTVARTGEGAGAANLDFLSNISHKSDYILGATNENYLAFTNNSVVFIVNPSPSTGPIYHIPNTFVY